MKMIRALIRPEREEAVLENLEAAGLFAVTKFPVLGRDLPWVQAGPIHYHLLAGVMLLIVVGEDDYPRALEAIERGGETGHPGDGQILAQEVSEVYTIRTNERNGEVFRD